MFHEYRDIVTKLKAENAHFEKIFERHNELDDKLTNDAASFPEAELDKMKREKLKLKDEAYSLIMEYKKAHNL